MARKTVDLLKPEQRLLLVSIPEDLTEREIAHYYTFTPDELAGIRQQRLPRNRLGFAVQLAVLRFPGFTLSDVPAIPAPVLAYIAEQVGVPAQRFSEYPLRDNTLDDHLKKIRQMFGYHSYGWSEMLFLTRQLVPQAMESDQRLPLIEVALTLMRTYQIIAPAVSTIERLVWNAHRIARGRVYHRLTKPLTAPQMQALQQVLQPDPERRGRTPLTWLRQPPGTASTASLQHILDRLLFLESLQLPSLPNTVPPYRIREMATRCRHYQVQALDSFKPPRQRAFLVAYLSELYRDLIDQTLDTFDAVILELLRKGERLQEKHLKTHAALLNRNMHTLASAVEAFLLAKEQELDPFATVFAVVSEEKLKAALEVIHSTARPADLDFVDLIEDRYAHCRKALLKFYETLEFKAVREPDPALQALDHVLVLAAFKQRVIAVEQAIPVQPRSRTKRILHAPLRHLTRTRWLKYALKKHQINPNYYEVAAFDRLKGSIRAGDIAISASRRFQDFDSYLIPADQWQQMLQQQETRLALTSTAAEYLAEAQQLIRTGLEDLQQNLGDYPELSLDEAGRLRLSEPDLEITPEIRAFQNQVSALLPNMQLTDLLLEVDAWTGFLSNFTHLTDGISPSGDNKMRLIAALMGLGMNIGLEKMALATPFSYKQLSGMTDWYIRQESLQRAQADLDNFVLHLPLSQFWGEGTASSSDGMRVPVAANMLEAKYNARYFGYRRGVTILTHVADIWMPFAQRIISTSDREALYVIDALCHHLTDFNLLEHYTDTAGYTYHVFALCAFLGFRFAPNIRSFPEQYLFSVEPFELESPFDALLKGQVESDYIYEDWSEMQRLVSSIRHGTVSAALIMRKLAAFPRQNKLAKALQEMGKLERTIFILEYLRSPELRRRVRVGLNKGELVHALARALIVGRSGIFWDRNRDELVHRANALMLLIAAIAAWNTVYLQQAITTLQVEGTLISGELLSHVSPLHWQHINFLGQYQFNPAQARPLDNLRPLKSDSRYL